MSKKDLNQNINMLATQFGKPVLVVETAYPFTHSWNDNTNNILGLENQLLDGYEASEEGQFSFLYDLISLVHDNDFGYGVCYWAPDWISTSQFGEICTIPRNSCDCLLTSWTWCILF